jgi:hypothetical protein
MSKPADKGRQPPPGDDYVVGNCRPPIATRFQEKCSGNPKGRPKGSKNFSTLFEEELAQMVVINENGKRKRVPKRRALIMRLINGALGNDAKAAGHVLEQIRRGEGSSEPSVAIAFDGREDKIVMGSIVQRIRMAEAPPIDVDAPRADSKDQS